MNEIEICPGVRHIEEDYRVYCTLVTGARLALLWDTGMGKRDIKAYVERAVSTPFLVLNSHGHYDHVGGNGRFGRVYLAREDWPLLGDAPSCALENLRLGAAFDLGDERAECVSLAGHTRGSRGLLLRERRLLLAGDALDPRLQLLGPEADSLAALRRTLEAVLALPFDEYLTSHAPRPLKKAQVEAHLRHLERLDPEALKPSVQAGTPVWRSEWREGPLRSVFVLGKAARKGIG